MDHSISFQPYETDLHCEEDLLNGSKQRKTKRFLREMRKDIGEQFVKGEQERVQNGGEARVRMPTFKAAVPVSYKATGCNLPEELVNEQ